KKILSENAVNLRIKIAHSRRLLHQNLDVKYRSGPQGDRAQQTSRQGLFVEWRGQGHVIDRDQRQAGSQCFIHKGGVTSSIQDEVIRALAVDRDGNDRERIVYQAEWNLPLCPSRWHSNCSGKVEKERQRKINFGFQERLRISCGH